jgi:NAD(P)-dependent dehydrogenase (short-subunit alcohol dehydrogenase family)
MRTLMISGASRGIGRAIAERALADGHRLSLGVRNPAALQGSRLAEAARHEPQRVRIQRYEARETGSAAAWVAASQQHFGGFDTLIHSAGVFSRVGLLYGDDEASEIETLWQVNVLGPWQLSRAAWPALAASGDGRIITLVSMSGKRVKGTLAGYAASKFALMALCQSMRNEGWEAGIRVTALCPSWVNTDMAAAVTSLPPQAMTQPQDLAGICADLLRLPARAVPFELAVNCQLER